MASELTMKGRPQPDYSSGTLFFVVEITCSVQLAFMPNLATPPVASADPTNAFDTRGAVLSELLVSLVL